MSSGDLIIGDSTTLSYFERHWTGADDVNHAAWNPYSNSIAKRVSSGAVTSCLQWGCGMCSPTSIQLMADNITADNGRVTDLWNRARTRAQNKLTSAVRGHDFDLGNYAAEGKETLGMCLGGLQRITGALRAAKKGDFAKAVKIAAAGDRRARQVLDTKDIASAHLGITYGVLPLMGDIYASSEAWAHLVSEQKLHQVASATEKVSGTDLVVHPYFAWQTDLKVRVAYDVILKRPLGVYDSLGLLDPLGIVWEGIPFSFVLDWFYPVGDYLDRLSVLPRLEFARLGLTSKFMQVSNLIPGSQKYPWGCSPWGTGYNLNGYTSKCTFVRFERGYGSLTASDIGTPRFKPLEKAMSSDHIKNAIALARALL